MTTCWPMDEGFVITDTFGYQQWRGGVHWGVDFGRPGGSGDNPVYAVRAGRVVMSGPAHGFGQWVVLDHPASVGGGTSVYGHIVPEVRVGQEVAVGQRIARISPVKSWATNGDVDPHLHLEFHRTIWATAESGDRLNPDEVLRGAGAIYPAQIGQLDAPGPPEANENIADRIWAQIFEQLMGPTP